MVMKNKKLSPKESEAAMEKAQLLKKWRHTRNYGGTPESFLQSLLGINDLYEGTKEELVDARSMLEKADALINGDRQRDYGDKLQNFSQIAMLWQGSIAHKLLANAKIIPEDVALMMIQVKIARLAKSPTHADSILDIAGYAGCYDKLQEERNTGVQLLGAIKDSGANQV